MRRIRRRKVLYGSMLSLIILMSFSLSCLKSSAAMLDDDASLVFNNRIPSEFRGWLAPVHNATGTTDRYNRTPWTYSLQGSSSSYLWRLTNYFDLAPDDTVLNSRTLIGWQYDTTLDFNVNYVYQFNIGIRYDGSSVNVPLADFSKVLLCFPSDMSLWDNQADNLTNSQVTSVLRNCFAPSSYSFVGNYVDLVYNVPIYPSTMFPDTGTLFDNGIEYIPIHGLFIWNQSAGDIAFALAQNGLYKRYSCVVFPRNTYPVKIYTPDQWATHVQEQGFNDLSVKIDQSTGVITQAIDDQTSEIVGSIEDATDNIINAGDPVDLSDLEAAHHAEHVLQNTLYSTSPYQATTTSAIFASLFSGGFEDAVDSINTWMDYAFNNNILIMYAVYYSIAAAIIYMAYRVVF